METTREECPVCRGSGECQKCHGENIQCPCGNGNCEYCQGTGSVVRD